MGAGVAVAPGGAAETDRDLANLGPVMFAEGSANALCDYADPFLWRKRQDQEKLGAIDAVERIPGPDDFKQSADDVAQQRLQSGLAVQVTNFVGMVYVQADHRQWMAGGNGATDFLLQCLVQKTGVMGSGGGVGNGKVLSRLCHVVVVPDVQAGHRQ